MAAIDDSRLAELLDRFVNDLGATVSVGNVLIGDKLPAPPPTTGDPLEGPVPGAGGGGSADRRRAGRARRPLGAVRPGRLAGQAATYDAGSGRYRLSSEQAWVFADPGGLGMPGAFQLAVWRAWPTSRRSWTRSGPAAG